MSVDYVKANENIVQDTKDLMLWQFNDASNIQKILEIVAEEYGSYEEAAERIFTSFLLTEATGFALDSIGEFLNSPREGQTDDEYRMALIFSAVGANSNISRDSIANLLSIVTGGIGGYFYRGSYHDLYIYLQQSCIDKEVATGFLDKYLPINTNASIIFESGTAFGFEGNDAAAGLDKVRASTAEGEVVLEFDYGYLETPSGVVLGNGDRFIDSDSNEYRTVTRYDLNTTMRGVRWLINSYVSGDTVQITVRNNDTGEALVRSITFQTNPVEELTYEITRIMVGSGALAQGNIYLSEETDDILYVGYETITDASLFSSRATEATEYNIFTEQATVVPADTVRHTYGDEGVQDGILYEAFSKNLLSHGNFVDDVTGDWTVVGSVASKGADNTQEYIPGIPSVTYELLEGSSVSITNTATTEIEGSHTFSVFLRPSALTYTIRSRANEYVFTWDGSQVVEVSSDFVDYGTITVGVLGEEWLRVYVTDSFVASEGVTVGVSAVADQGSGATLQLTCAQFEPWTEATSYIPTQGTPQERAADIFAFTEEPVFQGTSDDHTFIIDNPQGNISVLSSAHFSSVVLGERVVEAGTEFTPEEDYGFVLDSVVARAGWSEGTGGEDSLDTEGPSFSESGKLAHRASLTSRDVLGIPEVADAGAAFEYELDSRFSEVVSLISSEDTYARPIVTILPFREFRSPDWDGSLIDPLQQDRVSCTGVAFRSPQATSQITSPETSVLSTLTKVNAGEPLSYTGDNGDLSTPGRNFYFEFEMPSLAKSDAISELYASADFARYTEQTQASSTTSTESVLRIALVSEYRESSSDYEVSAQVIVLNNSSTVNSVNGDTSVDNHQVVGKPYSQVYSNPSSANPVTVGFLVDPIQRIIRVFVNGVPYDGNGGIVKITSLGADHNDPDANVGDILFIPVEWDHRLMFQIGGTTDITKAEPSSIEDYGSIRFNYDLSDLQYTEQLPQNTSDIFGRIIGNGD